MFRVPRQQVRLAASRYQDEPGSLRLRRTGPLIVEEYDSTCVVQPGWGSLAGKQMPATKAISRRCLAVIGSGL